jgi:hypothetical protein
MEPLTVDAQEDSRTIVEMRFEAVPIRATVRSGVFPLYS